MSVIRMFVHIASSVLDKKEKGTVSRQDIRNELKCIKDIIGMNRTEYSKTLKFLLKKYEV